MVTLTDTLLKTDLALPSRKQGKVRDLYQATTTSGQEALLIIATDRISAFDVVMPNGIPGKGAVLTQLSMFWFNLIAKRLDGRLKHHVLSTDPADVVALTPADQELIRGRVMVGRRCKVIPIECVARGYLAGSAWQEYRETGAVCGIALPAGLARCQELPEPIFTPATKAETGHDLNIDFDRACEIAGRSVMETLRDLTLEIYSFGHEFARERGIILADTKFEFGLPMDSQGDNPILIDEVLTPDSSRFWPVDDYEIGREQVSFDKQYVRNYLQELVEGGRWDKEPPAPVLPDEVVRGTQEKYLEALRALSGCGLDN